MIPDDDAVVPPKGHILVQDQDGNRFWVAPDELMPGPVVTGLTPSQVERIRAIKHVLREHDNVTLDETLKEFSRDQNPDSEIALMEHIARVYQRELDDRPDADERERALLYKVVLSCSLVRGPGDVLSTVPEAKTLRDIDRVLARYASETGPRD